MLFEGKTYILWLLHVKRTKEKEKLWEKRILQKRFWQIIMMFCGYYEWITFAGGTENPAGNTGKYVNPFHSTKRKMKRYMSWNRDVAKYWKEKVELAICGIENQSVVEKNMPFRVIGYDGTAYRSQLLEERKKILPVVTIVLYFGTDRHWNSEKILNL